MISNVEHDERLRHAADATKAPAAFAHEQDDLTGGDEPHVEWLDANRFRRPGVNSPRGGLSGQAEIAVGQPARNGRGVIARQALFDVLSGAERVTLVSAPAGSGKSVLLRSWIAAGDLSRCAAWVSVRREERDSQRFWLSVLESLRGTGGCAEQVRAVTASPDLDGWNVVERLLEDLSGLDRPVWLVIDDLHELQADEARRQLELLLLRAPQQLRFVLAARRDLHLGLHRLRLEGELTEVRACSCRMVRWSRWSRKLRGGRQG
jgi:LuxR family transcriptional regulator, maltose regulon positive regulatory protein